MHSPEQKLENSCFELQQDILRYFSRLSEFEESYKKRAAGILVMMKIAHNG